MTKLATVAAALGMIGCVAATGPSPATRPAALAGADFTVTLATPTKIEWTARVPTGGWTLKTDRVDVAEKVAKVYVTLTRPGDGAMVTQAFVTHRGDRSTDSPVASAELYARGASTGDYVRVAQSTTE